MSKLIIRKVAPKLFKIYFDEPYTEIDVKIKVNEIGYHVLYIEYFRGIPVVLVSKQNEQ